MDMKLKSQITSSMWNILWTSYCAQQITAPVGLHTRLVPLVLSLANMQIRKQAHVRFFCKNYETGFVYRCFTNILLFPSMPVICKDTWIFAKLVSSKCLMISRNSGKSASSEIQLGTKGVHPAEGSCDHRESFGYIDSNQPIKTYSTNRLAHVS